MKTPLIKICALVSLASIGAIFSASAQDFIPKLVNYQGRLTDAGGQPLASGTYRVKFGLFNSPDPVQTNVIWGATYNVVVVLGQFNLVLGASGGTSDPTAAVNDLGFAFSGDRYLQMSVLTDGAGNNLPAPRVLLPRQQILSAPFALNGIPTGSVMPFAGTTPPAGWLLCNGATLYGTNLLHTNLFRVIAKTYGSGNGTVSSFNLPDLRGRTAVGAGQGSGLVNRTLAATPGTDTITQVPNHAHSAGTLTALSNGAHDHGRPHNSIAFQNSGADYEDGEGRRIPPGLGTESIDRQRTTVDGAHTHLIGGITGNNNGGVASVDNLQPSLVLNYIIKL
jgi:microcystin-dependent protein